MTPFGFGSSFRSREPVKAWELACVPKFLDHSWTQSLHAKGSIVQSFWVADLGKWLDEWWNFLAQIIPLTTDPMFLIQGPMWYWNSCWDITYCKGLHCEHFPDQTDLTGPSYRANHSCASRLEGLGGRHSYVICLRYQQTCTSFLRMFVWNEHIIIWIMHNFPHICMHLINLSALNRGDKRNICLINSLKSPSCDWNHNITW